MNKPLLSPRTGTTLIILLVLAAFLSRLYTVPNTAFLMDNILHFYDLEHFIEKGEVPTMGASMSGQEARIPGGFSFILMMVPYFLTHSVTAMRWFGMLIGMAFALLYIAYIWRKTGRLDALLLSMLLLFNPYFVIASSNFWNAYLTFLPIFALFILFIELWEETIPKAMASLIVPLIVLIVQEHFAMFFTLTPLAIIFFIMTYGKWRWRDAIIGVLAGALLYVPYLVSEIQSGFANTHAMLTMSAERVWRTLPQVYAHFIFPTSEFSYYLGRSADGILSFYTKGNPLGVIQLIANAITLVLNLIANVFAFSLLTKKGANANYLAGYTLPSHYRKGLIFVLLTMAITLVTFTFFKIPPHYWHYLYALYPLSFFPLLVLFDFLKRKHTRLARGMLVFYAVNMFVMASAVFHFYRTSHEPINYASQCAITTTLLDDAKGRPFFLYTTFNEHTGTHYETHYNIPRFYKAIATYFLKRPWNETRTLTNADVAYIIESKRYPPVPAHILSNADPKELYRKKNHVLYRVDGNLPPDADEIYKRSND